MKKIFTYGLSILLVMILLSCGYGTMLENDNDEVLSYIVSDNTYTFSEIENTNVVISYPQVSLNPFENSSNDTAKQINSILLDTALNNYEDTWGIDNLSIDGRYSIVMLSSQTLCVVFQRSAYKLDLPHPTDECFAVTIDLTKGENFNLSNFITSYDDISPYIIEGNYKVLYGSLKVYEPTEVWQVINEKYCNEPLENHVNDFYLSNNDLCLIISDLTHGGGDFSVISIPYK